MNNFNDKLLLEKFIKLFEEFDGSQTKFIDSELKNTVLSNNYESQDRSVTKIEDGFNNALFKLAFTKWYNGTNRGVRDHDYVTIMIRYILFKEHRELFDEESKRLTWNASSGWKKVYTKVIEKSKSKKTDATDEVQKSKRKWHYSLMLIVLGVISVLCLFLGWKKCTNSTPPTHIRRLGSGTIDTILNGVIDNQAFLNENNIDLISANEHNGSFGEFSRFFQKEAEKKILLTATMFDSNTIELMENKDYEEMERFVDKETKVVEIFICADTSLHLQTRKTNNPLDSIDKDKLINIMSSKEKSNIEVLNLTSSSGTQKFTL